MSCLAVVVCPNDAVGIVRRMLCAMATRGVKSYKIATPEGGNGSQKLEGVSLPNSSSIAIGYGLRETTLEDTPQPIENLGTKTAIAGRIFPRPSPDEARYLMNNITDLEDSWSFLQQNLGAYAFAILKNGDVAVGRDPSGAAPLYIAEIGQVTAFATERKALWSVGARATSPFPPGSLITISGGNAKRKTFSIPQAEILKGEELPRLLEALSQATERRLSKLKRVALAFSGGVDSSILARLAKMKLAEVELIHTVFSKESKELQHAREASHALGLGLTETITSMEEVEDAIPNVLWAIEDPNVQSLEIALPIYFSAGAARRLGCQVMMTGQGADELFGGYARYQRIYASQGELAVQYEMRRDIFEMHEKNLARDEKVCARVGVELRSPFWDVQVISTANSIPVSMKLRDPQDPLRKRILRELAARLGLPEKISQSPKKAIQYGTGSHRILQEIARRNGKKIKEYVASRFEEVKEREQKICRT